MTDRLELRELLIEIAEARGPFKMDNHDFAVSVIENSQKNARKALELLDAGSVSSWRRRQRAARVRVPDGNAANSTIPILGDVKLRKALSDLLVFGNSDAELVAKLESLIGKERLDEAKDWLVVLEAACASERHRRRCLREGRQRVADLQNTETASAPSSISRRCSA